MNKKKRKFRKYIKMCGTAKQRKRNKLLCDRYPFLIPRGWDDKPIWADGSYRKYGTTYADDFPPGWWKSFGIMMCEELREELLKYHYLDKYRVVQIKEKYGELRFYDGGYPIGSAISDIIEKYSVLSCNICLKCGKPDVYSLNYYGWISPYCEDCLNKIERNYRGGGETPYPYMKFVPEGSSNRMSDFRSYYKYSQEKGKEYREIDISSTAQKIRDNWERMHKK